MSFLNDLANIGPASSSEQVRGFRRDTLARNNHSSDTRRTGIRGVGRRGWWGYLRRIRRGTADTEKIKPPLPNNKGSLKPGPFFVWLIAVDLNLRGSRFTRSRASPVNRLEVLQPFHPVLSAMPISLQSLIRSIDYVLCIFRPLYLMTTLPK